MASESELERLISRVEFRQESNEAEGIDEFRDLLEVDREGRVLRFLCRSLPKLKGQVRGGIAFVLAEHYRKTGAVQSLRELFASNDEYVRESVLNALWGEPGSNPEPGPAIVQMAIDAANDASPGVRTEVSYVLQNQNAWGVDVAAGIGTLRSLLKDPNSRVRHQAAYAVGNLAKSKRDMTSCIAQLRRNVKHKDMYVRESSAWALWQLSRYKHDVSSAVPELVWLLTDTEEYNEPRKKAAGALVHHARKSPENTKVVKAQVQSVVLDKSRREIRKFIEELAACPQHGTT